MNTAFVSGGCTVHYVMNDESLAVAIAELTASVERHGWLAVDVETSAMTPHEQRVPQLNAKGVVVLLDSLNAAHQEAAMKIMATYNKSQEATEK